MPRIGRRALIAGAAGTGIALAATAPWISEARLPGTLDGASHARGHRLRRVSFPPPAREREVDIAIAGAGVAGLAAGWRLAEAGFSNFAILELEDKSGGNARSGRNAISAYPLGAHYLPVPNREATALRHMLQRFGIMTGTQDGLPVYDPYQLCADLEQRLFWRGRWHEGLFPSAGLSAQDRDERARFDALMSGFSERIGKDGRPAFAIPSAYSSSDPDLIALDRISFARWLDTQQLKAPLLRGHIRYCCRDDYGCEPADVSAWAGIHYFAARRGWAAGAAGDRELTWPEGNARLTGLMARSVGKRLLTGHSVFSVREAGGQLIVDMFDHARGESLRIRAAAAILAMPHFIARRVAPVIGEADGFSYAPWIVANISVDQPPQGKGAPLAWDNVSATSESLGYVVATHQTSSAAAGPSVLTWYLPLSTMPPTDARRMMLERSLGSWQAMVRDDLLTMHPELATAISRIDIWRWGHAMIRPIPGFIHGIAPRVRASVRPPLFLAHSDMSGLSLFEEAHYQGVSAAESALRHLGHRSESLL